MTTENMAGLEELMKSHTLDRSQETAQSPLPQGRGFIGFKSRGGGHTGSNGHDMHASSSNNTNFSASQERINQRGRGRRGRVRGGGRSTGLEGRGMFQPTSAYVQSAYQTGTQTNFDPAWQGYPGHQGSHGGPVYRQYNSNGHGNRGNNYDPHSIPYGSHPEQYNNVGAANWGVPYNEAHMGGEWVAGRDVGYAPHYQADRGRGRGGYPEQQHNSSRQRGYSRGREIKRVLPQCFMREVTGEVVVRLVETEIVVIKPDGEITLNSNGWRTTTTLQGMNDALNIINVSVVAKGDVRLSEWKVLENNSEMVYQDGMVLPAKGLATAGRGHEVLNRFHAPPYAAAAAIAVSTAGHIAGAAWPPAPAGVWPPGISQYNGLAKGETGGYMPSPAIHGPQGYMGIQNLHIQHEMPVSQAEAAQSQHPGVVYSGNPGESSSYGALSHSGAAVLTPNPPSVVNPPGVRNGKGRG